MFVTVAPGATALVRMPRGPYMTALGHGWWLFGIRPEQRLPGRAIAHLWLISPSASEG